MQRNTIKRFASRAKLHAWLERNHAKAAELLLQCYKVHAAERGVTYREALDEALCFGWIDGVRHSRDADSFLVRFTPRKPASRWSQVNLKRMRELEALGLVTPAGLAARKAASPKAAGYSFESKPVALAPKYARQLRSNERAYEYFERQPPWYRRTSSFWVMSAKQEQTRERRLQMLIDCCAENRPIGPLARKPAGKVTQ